MDLWQGRAMKAATLMALFTMTACSSPDEKSLLEKYRWEKRVIVHDQASDEALELRAEERAPFLDRDLVFVAADDALREAFDIDGPEPTFILIGKDGSEKGRQSGTLNLPEWFALIDTMPMRRREMQEGRE